MGDIKDLLGLEGPICKVIDCFRDGISGLLAPWQYKRMEKAKIEMKEKGIREYDVVLDRNSRKYSIKVVPHGNND